MRTFLAILVAVTGLTASYPVFACGGGEAIRPVDTEFDQVSQLRAEASRLDARATNAESAAASLDRAGDQMTIRARELRSLVSARMDISRERLLNQVQQLVANAALSHAQASQRRAEASQLRLSARELRDRAVRIAGGRPGGGGWRGAQTVSVQDI